jgi:hypothetical protein
MEKSFKPTWEHHSFITPGNHDDVIGGPAARISVLPLRFPKYSVQFGYMRNQIFQPFIPPGVDSAVMVVHVAEPALSKLEELAAESRKAEAEAQAAWVAKLAEDEARKKDKKARHDQNLQRRREEDRQRTQAAKAGNRK